MKLKSFALGSALVAMVALTAIGCNENPVDPDAPTAPSNVQAVSLTGTSVGLKWTASSTAGVTYNVYVDGAIKDSAVATTSTTVTGVAAGSHTFMVKAENSSGTESAGASVVWAAADRYTNDKNAPSVTLRLYEFSAPAPLGSGLGLDGGPRNISAATGEGGVFSGIQLAMNTNANNTFDIGPAAGFDDFAHVNEFDQNVYVSDSSFSVNSLNEWYGSTKSLEDYIPKPLDNTRVFTMNNAGATGEMFFVRTGTSSANYHYARVLVKSTGGSRLQGSGTSRYVEVEISYQATAGVPYAKFVAGRPSTPGSLASHKYHR